MYYVQEVFFFFFWGGGVSFAILKVKLLHFFLFLFCMVNLIEKKGETLSIRDAHKGSPKEDKVLCGWC